MRYTNSRLLYFTLCDGSVCHSFCHSVNRITDERGNGRRPTLANMARDACLEVINFRW